MLGQNPPPHFPKPSPPSNPPNEPQVSTGSVDKNQTFVYEQAEVTKTGRTAFLKRNTGKLDILFEITPVDQMVGSWKKWVRDMELFEVQG